MIRHLHPTVKDEMVKEKAFKTMQKMIFAEIHEDCRKKGRLHVVGSAKSDKSDESEEDDDDYEIF